VEAAAMKLYSAAAMERTMKIEEVMWKRSFPQLRRRGISFSKTPFVFHTTGHFICYKNQTSSLANNRGKANPWAWPSIFFKKQQMRLKWAFAAFWFWPGRG
jgi:hypothetical protein